VSLLKLPQPSYRYRAKVVRVIDGDTIVVDVDLGWKTWQLAQSVRLFGINAPEMNTHQGPGAADFLEGLVRKYGEAHAGDYWLVLESRKDKLDKYGRWLGLFFGVHGDGAQVCLNDEMVAAGYATRI
jgi:micrococcal nuclease